MKAVVYTSQTGFTAWYARLLAEKAGLPAIPLERAARELGRQDGVVFLGWLCAGRISGLKKARRSFDVRAVCAVGMAPGRPETVRKIQENNPTGGAPLFYLRGGYAPEKLKCVYRVMMKPIEAMTEKAAQKDSEAGEMRDALARGANWSTPGQLVPLLAWLKGQA